ncbi:MAG: EVE domain-containing protein [Thermofilum sp.]|nr:EVE domain-containing protein [Thermofilum sp.]
MNYWTLVGTLDNWKIGIERGIWGVRERARPLWGKVQPGDKVVFYAVKTGVLGYGTVEGKFESRELLWPEEKEKGEPIWPMRLKIRVEKVYREPKKKPDKMLVGFPINKLDPETFEEVAGER